MKITFFIGSLSGGGAERVICNLSNYMISKGHDITVLTAGKSDSGYGLSEKVKIISLEGKRRIRFSPLRAILKMRRLKKFIKANDTDIYVAFLPKTIKAIMCYKNILKCPVVLSERCSPLNYNSRKRKVMLKCFKAAGGAVFLTEEIKDFYTDKITLKNYKIIPNAVNPEFIKPPFSGERRKAIVAVGRHSVQKNFTMLIDSFSEVAKDFPEYTLEIYGKGELTEEYKRQCEELGITDKVIFPGFCKNMREKLYGASLFVLSSDFEGMPNALIEAMSLSTPCISTDCAGGGARCLIEDGINGLLVPVGDKTALAAAMVKILGDKDYAEILAERAGKIKETLSSEKIYGEWEEYLFKVANGEI